MSTKTIIIMVFDKFGEALSNSDELTTFIEVIELKLSFDQQSKNNDKDEPTKINVLDIINNVDRSERYILPRRTTNVDSIKKTSSNIDKTTTIKVSNISNDITDTNLRTLFEEFGNIRRIHIPKGKKSGDPLGYAFITYNERIEAETAINKMHKYAYEYCILDITWAK